MNKLCESMEELFKKIYIYMYIKSHFILEGIFHLGLALELHRSNLDAAGAGTPPRSCSAPSHDHINEQWIMQWCPELLKYVKSLHNFVFPSDILFYVWVVVTSWWPQLWFLKAIRHMDTKNKNGKLESQWCMYSTLGYNKSFFFKH